MGAEVPGIDLSRRLTTRRSENFAQRSTGIEVPRSGGESESGA
jgi:hypothetical protein